MKGAARLICGRAAALLIALCPGLLPGAAGAAAPLPPVPVTSRPAMAGPYLDLAVTYAIYARSIWHEADAGGYWGGGVGEKNGNGAVRGMCNTMLGYAVLAHAWNAGWLSPQQKDELTSAGLDRAGLLCSIRSNLEHIIAHHTSADKPLEPKWGDSWQSSLWLSAAGYAAFFVWDDLSPDLKEGLRRMSRREADRIAAAPARTYQPGNTGAEENAWDTLAPALALALEPKHSNAENWWKTLRSYAANSYSVPADRGSSAPLGASTVGEVVSTWNLFDDFTLDNHGFFHPDYVQVTGQHLGEAWQLLTLGDRLNGTDFAERFRPYSLHHLADVWNGVLSRLLLPDGEFAFPSGNDWTFHCSMNQSYLAYIATALQDPLAGLAEERAIRAALKRRSVSPPGRILGDTNLEWWWEPLLIKRCSTALLHHILRPAPEVTSSTEVRLDRDVFTRFFPDSDIWLHRNARSFVSVSWGKRRMGTMVPFEGETSQPRYMTLPIDDGILPGSVQRLAESGDSAALLELTDGRRCAVIVLPNSVLWLSPVPLRPLGIENDTMTDRRRVVSATTGSVTVPAIAARAGMELAGGWVNIDNRFGHVSTGRGFRYLPAGSLNRRSAAIDRLVPQADWGAWQMIPGTTAAQTEAAAREFSATRTGDRVEVTLRDGADGKRYRIQADLAKGANAESPGPLKSIKVQPLD